MKKRLGLAAFTACSCLAVIGVVAVTNAGAALNTFTVTLNGTNVVPSQGHGFTGSATITMDNVTNQVCISSTNTYPGGTLVTGVQIFSGLAGLNGPGVIDFGTTINGCVTGSATAIANIAVNPSAFYLQIDTEQNMSIRGQLVLVPSSTTGGPNTSLPATTSSSANVSTSSTAVSAVVATPRFTG